MWVGTAGPEKEHNFPSILKRNTSNQQSEGAESFQGVGGEWKRLCPTLCLVTSLWELGIGCGGSIYNMDIVKCYKPSSPGSLSAKSWLVNIFQHSTENRPMISLVGAK